MSNFKVSKVPFYQPQAGFNKTSNNSPTVQSTQKIAPVGSYQYAASTLKNKSYAEKRAQQPVQQKPVQQTQQPVQQKPVQQTQQQPVQQQNKNLEDKEELTNV